jgi:hypothetical protein
VPALESRQSRVRSRCGPVHGHRAGRLRLYGSPPPAPGARCVFEPELLLAARYTLDGSPPSRELTATDGMLVHEDPTNVLTWPCRLWRVKDVDQRLWDGARVRWFRCRALTVVEEVPS